jgi:class 3 adenylate cyclase
MQEAASRLRLVLEREFNISLRIGIGIHFRPVTLGRIEYPGKRQITIIGDSVNTASRIDGMTKELSAPILPSDKVVAYLPFVGTDRELSGQCLLACAEREAPIESTLMMASAGTAELRMILLREGCGLRKEREQPALSIRRPLRPSQ